MDSSEDQELRRELAASISDEDLELIACEDEWLADWLAEDWEYPADDETRSETPPENDAKSIQPS